MAVALTINTPHVNAALGTTRTRYTMPTSGAATYVRIFSASALSLELVDAADSGSLGTAYETIPAGVVTTRKVRRGEFCLVGSTTQTVEVTALTKQGGMP